MEKSNMKNMVVLRNLPSNIVEEAFVVLKSNKKVKKLEKIENIKNSKIEQNGTKNKDYVLKEAEMLVSDYITKIENIENKNKINKIKVSKKFKRWAYISTTIAIIEAIIIMF